MMCLTIVDTETETPKKNFGYKVVIEEENELRGQYFSQYVYKPKQWNKSMRKRKINGYLPCFHIWRYKKDAFSDCDPDCVVKRVEFRDVVATGRLFYNPVIVAREFRFI